MINQPLSDRDLLEYAARAAGIEIHNAEFVSGPHLKGTTRSWNPLVSDADAFRLMVELDMDIRRFTYPHMGIVSATSGVFEASREVLYHECDKPDEKRDGFAATRRAIVRAAAEIGRAKLEGS